MLYDDTTASQTYELYGPKNYSTAEIAELVDREIYKERRHINVPKSVLKPVAGLLNQLLWWPVSSADEVEREFHDQVIDDTAKTFKDLGIEPGEISNFIYHYLVSKISRIQVEMDAGAAANTLRSKDSEALRTTICRQPRRRRGKRRGNISTSWMTSKMCFHRPQSKMAEWFLRCKWDCTYVVPRPFFLDSIKRIRQPNQFFDVFSLDILQPAARLNSSTSEGIYDDLLFRFNWET